MADIRVISYNEHGNKRWFKPADFRFAAKDKVVAVTLSEIPKAMLSLPLAFIKTDLSYQPVVVQGLLEEKNLLITPNGQWVADYIPLLYRTMPFKLAKNAEEQFVLCVDHESGLVTDTPAGYRFLEDEKKMSAEANANATLLMQFEADRPRTAQACKLLGDYGVIEPWVLQLQQNDEIVTTEGLYRINENKLMEVPAEVLAQLRDCGGLMLCYAQLISTHHMQHLGTLLQRTHWAVKAAESATKVAPLNITDDNGILSFAKI